MNFKTAVRVITCALTLAFVLPLDGFSQSVREKNNFDFDWKFTLGDNKAASEATFDDSKWEYIQLPHDYSIKQAFNQNMRGGGSNGYIPGGIGWYRKQFDVPASYKGKQVYILFDGVYMQSDVYINGHHLGFHPYGYDGFEYELTQYLQPGKQNTIAVRVDHSDAPTSRWYSGSGINRHAWLIVNNPVHVANWGTYVTTPNVSATSADVKIVSTIQNNTAKQSSLTIEQTVLDAAGKKVTATSSKQVIAANTSKDVEGMLQVSKPSLWSTTSPYLYTMETVVKAGNKILDSYTTPFGIRTTKFDPDKGFFLNGEHIKLMGVAVHTDAGVLGTAVPDRSNERRLEILKEYGCNAIRCSHNPPTPEFLDMCDRLGLMVLDEAFDKWTEGYYNKYFNDWWQKDLDAMITRDRNHPSIILWSIGNEVSEITDRTGAGAARAKMLQDRVHQTEPTRKVMVALQTAQHPGIYNETGFAQVLDVCGYNYCEPWFLPDHEKYPDRIMFVSEAFPYYTGKGLNVRDYKPDNPWYVVAKNDFLAGQFVWAGVDYIGESSGWPSKGWPTCLFDMCMFEKPFAAFDRAVWNPKPMVSIAVADQSLDIDPGKDHWQIPFLASSWTFPQYKGHVIEVHTITNCDSVELWVNNRTLGRRRTADYTNNTIVWHVPYMAGTIQAKGYNKGKEVAQYQLQTAGKPAKIILQADRSSIKADGQDLSHVTVCVVDDKGVLVPNADKLLSVEVSGDGKFLGIENGDLRRENAFAGNKLPSYFGKALVILQSQRKGGMIRLKVSAEGLPDAEIVVESK